MLILKNINTLLPKKKGEKTQNKGGKSQNKGGKTQNKVMLNVFFR